MVDLEHWEAFASFAPAVRRRGIGVTRVAPPRRGPTAVLARMMDRSVFGRYSLAAVDLVSAGVLAEVMGPPTVDVLGPEDVIETLRERLAWSLHPVAARVPDTDHVRLLFDKLAMTRFAETIPVPVPRSWEERPSGVLPLVVKGRSGAGGMMVRIARDDAQVDAAIAELEPKAERGIFFQELSVGRLTNVGGVASRGRILASCCYRAIPRADDPLGPPEAVEVVESPGIEASLAPLLAALDYSGVFCIDYIERPDGSAVLIDFNPRIFGAWLALQSSGTDLLGAYVALVTGGTPPPRHPPAVGERRDVRLLPRPGAESVTAVAQRLQQTRQRLEAVSPITGRRFVRFATLQALRLAGRDTLRLLTPRPLRARHGASDGALRALAVREEHERAARR